MTEAESAALHWRAQVTRPLSERENAVYEIALPNGARAALRLHRTGYQRAQAIRSELWWCAEMAKAGLPVPRPVPLPDGRHLLEPPTGRCASVVEWVNGHALGAAGIPLPGSIPQQAVLHHALGGLLARVHTASDRLALPAGFDRHRWDTDGLVGDTPTWGRFWEHVALTPDQAGTLRAARDWLRTLFGNHQISGADIGLIHADALRENVMMSDRGLSLIDFDDAGFGFRLYDLGVVLSQNLYEPGYRQIRAALIDGYSTMRPLRADLVDTFTLARTLSSVGWTMARVDPAAPVVQTHIARAVMMAERVMT